MKCPCNGCDERKMGCHSNCTKDPSYDEWKQWSNERAAINRAKDKDRSDYLHSLVNLTRVKRRHK